MSRIRRFDLAVQANPGVTYCFIVGLVALLVVIL